MIISCSAVMAAVMAAAMAVAWDVTARDKNKYHGGRRGGKALLAEFLPSLRRRLPDYLNHAIWQRKGIGVKLRMVVRHLKQHTMAKTDISMWYTMVFFYSTMTSLRQISLGGLN
jgi:hypothetical protein